MTTSIAREQSGRGYGPFPGCTRRFCSIVLLIFKHSEDSTIPTQFHSEYQFPTTHFTMSLSPNMPDASRVFSTFTNPLETQSTVIIGAGVVGLSTAYYLAHSGHTKPDTIHLIESSPELLASASGKAAGFCAPDCQSTMSPLLTITNDADKGLHPKRHHWANCLSDYTRS